MPVGWAVNASGGELRVVRVLWLCGHIEQDRQKHRLMEAQGGTLKDGFEFTNGKLSIMGEVRQKALLGVILSGSIGTLSGVEDTAGA